MTEPHPAECGLTPTGCPFFPELEASRRTVAELSQQVETDPLTGLFNRRHLFSSLDVEMERTRRSGQATSLMMIDIDHFKAINDTHGHLVGDRVLRELATLFLQTLRKLDMAARYGGEEFAVILPATPLLIAAEVAERLRQSVEAHRIEIGQGQQVNVTASFGLATFLAHQNVTTEVLLGSADNQLYKAKKSGRNQVCFQAADIRRKNNLSAHEREALLSDDGEQD